MNIKLNIYIQGRRMNDQRASPVPAKRGIFDKNATPREILEKLRWKSLFTFRYTANFNREP